MSNEHWAYCLLFRVENRKNISKKFMADRDIGAAHFKSLFKWKAWNLFAMFVSAVKHFTRPNLILTHSRTFRPAAFAVAAETCEPNIVQLLPVTFAASFGFFPVKFHLKFWISSYFDPLETPDYARIRYFFQCDWHSVRIQILFSVFRSTQIDKCNIK